jgi:outer membrane receptor for ferric coprogen and ferric-rhodotorulic acid
MDMHAHAGGLYKLNRIALLVAIALPSLAQAAPDELATATPTETAAEPIQRVEVSGRKAETSGYTVREQGSATPLALSLRETPQSVSVVTLQRIEDQNLRSVTDIVNNTTGVSVNQYETNRAGFTARGFDIDNLQIDGIPTTYDQAWSAGESAGSLATYERVEVVRGATGLMTGAGNPSAAINLVRKHADSKEVSGWVEAGIGRWNERRVLGDVSTPLNETGTVRARIVGEYTKGDSWVDLLHNRSHTVYATIAADLGPKTLLQAGYGYQDTKASGPMWGSLPYWYSDGTPTNWDRSKTTAADWTRLPSTYGNGFLSLEHRFDNGWTLRANANHGERKGDSYLLYLSGMPDRITGAGMSDFSGSYHTVTKQKDLSLHLSGPFTLAGRTHEAAFGVSRMKQTFNSDNRAADFGGVSSTVTDFNNWNGAAYPEPTWGTPTFYEGSETTQDALYGVARFSLADPVKLIVGARVTDYEKNGRGLWKAAYAIKHDKEVTPYAGLVYDINEHYSAYASYTDIFQPQNLKDFNGNMLDPIVGKSSELGIKGEFFGGRLNASAAVFQIKQDGLGQEAGMVLRPGSELPETYYRAAPGAKSEGIEFDLSGRFATGWNASAGYTHYRARDAAGVEVNSIYPRRLLRVFTTYQLPGAWSGLTVGGGVNWEGRTWTLDPLAPASTNGIIEQKAFALVNLMARYQFSEQLSAQLNLNNVFDKTHFGMFAAYGGINYQAPRSAALTLRYRF